MRRLAAISLLLILLALASSASTIACAANCAQPAATPLPAMTMHMHHHGAMVRSGGVGFAARHCAGPAPRVLAQRIVVPGSQDGPAVEPGSAEVVRVVCTSEVEPALFAASPPGPPVLPTQLRI